MGMPPTWEKVVTYLLEPPDFGNLGNGHNLLQLLLPNQIFRILPLCIKPTQGCQKCDRMHRDAKWIGGLSNQSSNLSCLCNLQQKSVIHACSDTVFEGIQIVNYLVSLMSSLSDRSEGPQCPWQARWHGKAGAHMKINLPIFKDKDAKDAATYQSWSWDLTVYHCAGCRDHTLLPYVIWSFQGYPGELVWFSGMDITLDDVLAILDEHYNNMKALDAWNQELFQLWMADQETISDWGVCLSRHLQVLAATFPNHFPPDCVAELKRDHFYGGLPKRLKATVTYLKVIPHEKTYSNYLHTVR